MELRAAFRFSSRWLSPALVAVICLTLLTAKSSEAHLTSGSLVYTLTGVITNSDPSSCAISPANPPQINWRLSDPWGLVSNDDPFKPDNFWLFDANCDNGENSFPIRIRVDDGYTSTEALTEAKKYGLAMGRLPKVLRTGVKGLTITKLASSWFALIHQGQIFGVPRKSIGAELEELLVHEAAHISIQPKIMHDPGWWTAQREDGAYVSGYAKVAREDEAESFLAYLAARYRPTRISASQKKQIFQKIPNRIAFFDKFLSREEMKPFTAVHERGGSYQIDYSKDISVEVGSSGSSHIRLFSRPESSVTITPTSDNTKISTVSGPLIFSTENWNVPQSITVTGVKKGTTSINYTSTSSDKNFNIESGKLPATTVEVKSVGSLVKFDLSFYSSETGPVTEGELKNIKVTRSGTLSNTVTLPEYIVYGEGVTNVDYQTLGDLTFYYYLNKRNQAIRILDDKEDEPTEFMTVTFDSLSLPDGVSPGTPITIEILDNDPTLVTLKGTGDVTEGFSKTFTISLGRELVKGESLTVPLTFGGTAHLGSDYNVSCSKVTNVKCNDFSNGNAVVTFKGPSSKSILFNLSAVLDNINESSGETVQIGLGILDENSGSGLGGGAIGIDHLADFKILESIATPTVSLTTSEYEAEEGSIVTVKATLSGILSKDTVIPIKVTQGSTADVEDYNLLSSDIIIRGGKISGNISLLIIDDTVDEPPESFELSLGTLPAGTKAGISDTAPVKIKDNDPTKVVLSGTRDNVLEGQTKVLTLSIGRQLVENETLEVPLNIGRGKSGIAYYGPSGSRMDYILTCESPLPAGVTCPDLNKELRDETVIFSFNGPSANSVELTLKAHSTAQDTETDSEKVDLEFDKFDNGKYKFPDGGAVGSDLLPVFNIVKAKKSNPIDFTDKTIWHATAVLTVETNTSTGNRVFVQEGGTVTARVTLSNAVPVPTCFRVYINDLSTATQKVDYVLEEPEDWSWSENEHQRDNYTGKICIPKGKIEGSTDINILEDKLIEDSESILLSTIGLYNKEVTRAETGHINVRVNIFHRTEVAIIDSGLGIPEIGITSWPSVTEGDKVGFTIFAKHPVEEDVTINLNVFDASGSDFVASENEGAQNVVISKGDRTVAFGVPTENDLVGEANGEVTVFVTTDNNDPVTYVPFAFNSASITVKDDDTAGVLVSPSDLAVLTESNTSYALSLQTLPANDVTVSVTSDNAHAQVEKSSVTFTPNNWFIPQSVKVTGVSEGKANITHKITSGDGNNYGSGMSIDSVGVTVKPKPNPVSLSVSSNGNITEGASPLTITATLEDANATGAALSIPVQVRSTGTTAAPADYTVTGTIEIAHGALSGTTTFTAVDDTEDELDETAVVELGSPLPSGLKAGASNHVTITISDNDEPYVSFAASSSVNESIGTKEVKLFLFHTAPATDINISYSIGGSATAGSDNDYTIQNKGTVAVAAGSSTASIPVVIIDDTLDEPNETIELTLADGPDYALSASKVYTLTITDNDVPVPGVTLSTATVNLTEGGTTGSYTVVLASKPSSDVSLTLTSGDADKVKVHGPNGTAGASATLTFTPANWNQSRTVTITPQDDSDTRNEEVAIAHATTSTDTDYVFSDAGSVSVSVTDDDEPIPEITVVLPDAEGDGRTGGQLVYPESGGRGSVARSLHFSVSAAPAPSSSLTVCVRITETGGDRVSASLKGIKSVVIPAGGTVGHAIAWSDTNTDDLDSVVTLEILDPASEGCPTAGSYQVSAGDGSDTALIRDDEPTVASLARTGTGGIDEGGVVVFTATLGRTLSAGEIMDVPLVISGTNVTTGDWSMAMKSGATNTGISLHDMGTLTPKIRFSGAGAQTATLEVTATSDGASEGSETFTIALGSNSDFDAASLGTNVGGGGDPHGTTNAFDVLVSDPSILSLPVVTITASPSTITEGTSAQFTLKAMPAPTTSLVVSLMVEDDATADFLASGSEGLKSLTLEANTASKIYTVATVADTTFEPHGQITVSLKDAPGYTVGTSGSATLSVHDDDVATTPTLFFAQPSLTTLLETGEPLVFDLKISRPYFTKTMGYIPLAVEGSATRGRDYRLQYQLGKYWLDLRRDLIYVQRKIAVQRFRIVPLNDTAVEQNETITIKVMEQSEATRAYYEHYLSGTPNTLTFTLQDEGSAPAEPTLSFASSSSTLSEDKGTHNVTINLDKEVPSGGLSLRYTVGGTALEGSGNDYTIQNRGTLALAAGATTASIPITIVDDALDEPNETITLTLTNGSGYTVGTPAVHTLTITDNDVAPQPGVTLSGTTVSVTEGGAPGSYTVVLASKPTANVVVTATSGDAAKVKVHGPQGTAGPQASLTFTPANWDTAQTVSVVPQDDSDADNESVTLTHGVSKTGGYDHVSASSVIVLITDDDTPTLSVALSPTSANEGDTGDKGYATVTFGLDPVRSQPTSFKACLKTTGTATHGTGADYQLINLNNETPLTVSNTCYTHSIPANTASGQVRLLIRGDDSVEADESIVLELRDPPQGVVMDGSRSTATYSILNDDTAPTSCDIDDVEDDVEDYAEETSNGQQHVARWKRVLAAFGHDNGYSKMTVAEAQQNSETYWSVRWDPVVEALECLATVASTDPVVTISGGSVITEGGEALFTVSATPVPTTNLEVKLTIEDDATSDFVSSSDEGTQTVTIPANQGSATHTLTTVNDSTDEANGDITATVVADTGYTVGTPNSATIAVNDDDVSPVPTLSVVLSPTSASEGDTGDKGYATVTFGLDPVRSQPTSFKACLKNTGTATHGTGADYQLINLNNETPLTVSNTCYTHSIPANTASGQVRLLIRGDDAVEADESIVLELRDPPQGVVVDGTRGTATYSILNDDTAPTSCDIDDVEDDVEDYAEETSNGQQHVARWKRVLAAFGHDNGYSKMTVAEAQQNSETYWSVRWDPVVAVLQCLANVASTDPVVTVSGGSVITEGGDALFTVSATPVPTTNLAVKLTIEDDATSDFVSSGDEGTQTVTIPANQGSATHTLTTVNDSTDEANGDITATVVAATGYTVGTPNSATIAVNDDDVSPVPTLSVVLSPTSASEGDTGDKGYATVTFGLDPVRSQPTSFKACLKNTGTATHGTGADYQLINLNNETPLTVSNTCYTHSIPANTASGQVRLLIRGDDAVEADESIVLELRDPPQGVVVDGTRSTATYSILNDDVAASDPVVSITGGTAITEGGTATFTLTAIPAPLSDLSVAVDVGDSGDFAVSGQTGPRTVVIGTGGTGTLTVTTDDDNADEANGSITATIKPGTGYTPSSIDKTASIDVSDNDASPVVSITGDTAITEGGTATFTFTAIPAPLSDLSVTVDVGDSGDFAVSGQTGPRTVVIGTGGTGTLTVTTDDDNADEANGSITATIQPGTGYTPSSTDKTVSIDVSDNDVSTGPTISINDVSAQENTRLMHFKVTLSEASTEMVRFNWETRESKPVSAQEGKDYNKSGRRYFFTPGQTSITLRVLIFNDSHDEGSETFEVVLSKPYNATILDGVGVGTIVNSDPLPSAWLSRFGRTVAEQALDGIEDRLTGSRAADVDIALAGHGLDFGVRDHSDSLEDGHGSQTIGGFSGHDDRGSQTRSYAHGSYSPDATGLDGSHTMTLDEALLNSRFTTTSRSDSKGGSLAFWGRASQSSFDGQEGTFSLTGDITTAFLGTDYARNKWLVGLALTRSTAKGRYGDTDLDPRPASQTCEVDEVALCRDAIRAGDGQVSSTLTVVIPYGSFQVSERFQLWGALGFGTGDVTLTPRTGGSLKSDISWRMAALGLRGEVLPPPVEGSGLSLAVVSDVLWVNTTSEKTHDLAAADTDVSRFRLGLEGSWHMDLANGRSFVPRLEIGTRYDGGDAETGFGIEVGAGLSLRDHVSGVSFDLSGRTLVQHDNDTFKDRGISVSFTYDPNPQSRRGPSLTVHKQVGGSSEGGVDALFAPTPLEDRTGSGDDSRWGMEAAYGFPVGDGSYTGSPTAGVDIAEQSRDYSVGWRLTPESRNAPDFSLGVTGTRRVSTIEQPDHMTSVDVTTRW